MGEDLRGEPADGIEQQRKPQRRGNAEIAHRRVDDRQLEHAERHRQPGRLVRERAVVDSGVEEQTDREHQRDELDRPPAVQGECKQQCRKHRDDARLDAAGQRVRHRRRRKARAANFAPAIVSAAGNAHCACDAGERERARVVGERRDRRIGVEHDPVLVGRERVRIDQVRKQRIVAVALAEPGRANHLQIGGPRLSLL